MTDHNEVPKAAFDAAVAAAAPLWARAYTDSGRSVLRAALAAAMPHLAPQSPTEPTRAEDAQVEADMRYASVDHHAYRVAHIPEPGALEDARPAPGTEDAPHVEPGGERVTAYTKVRKDVLARAALLDGGDFAGNLDVVDDDTLDGLARTVAIVISAYGWTIDDSGRLAGLVAGDMGYATTGIVLDAETMAALRPSRDAVLEEPPLGLLVSMALRDDHAFLMREYGAGTTLSIPALTQEQREGRLRSMRQLWEEATGHGFWSPAKNAGYEESYRALKASQS